MASIVLLMYERKNPYSYWKHLIALMPTEKECIIYWTDEELDYLSKTSFTKDLVHNLNDNLDSFYRLHLKPIFDHYPNIFYGFTVDDFKWAMASFWSRGYWLDEDELFPTLVPFADMFNHHPSNESKVHLKSS